MSVHSHIKSFVVAILATGLLFAPQHLDAESSFASNMFPPQSTPLSDVTFVAFDTETTGFSAVRNRILEVGVVKFRNGKILDRRSWLINPQHHISPRAENVHHISEAMVTNSPTFAAFYPEFETYIKGTVLMAHNASFDVAFVREELRRYQHPPPPNTVIDSLRLFRKWFPDSPSHRLGDLAAYTQVKDDKFHRAEADSAYLALIFFAALKNGTNPATLGDVLKDAGGGLHF